MRFSHLTYCALALSGLSLVACKPTERRLVPHKLPQQEAPAEEPQAPAETPQTPTADTPQAPEATQQEQTAEQQPAEAPKTAASDALVGVNSVRQGFNLLQPWEKEQAREESSLGVYLGNGMVLTTGNIAQAATYVELSLPDGSRTATARIVRHDAELNLALVALEHAEEQETFFATRTALTPGEPMALGDRAEVAALVRGLTPVTIPLEAAGVENSRMPNLNLRLTAPLPDGHSHGAPIVRDGKLVGLSNGYGDMELTAINAEQITRFLNQKEDDGLPLLGVSFSAMDDPAFCAWLKADRGLYIGKVQPGSAADQAGLKEGDVVTAIDGLPIDNRGRCQHPLYGLHNAASVMRSLKPLGEDLNITIVRNGETQEVTVPMNRDAAQHTLFGTEKPGVQPRYAIWGGLVFQPLTESYLSAIRSQAGGNLPIEFLKVVEREDDLRAEGYREPVAITLVIPTPATLGYESLRFCLVKAVNGQTVHDYAEFLKLLDTPTEDGLVRITTNKAPFDIYVDRTAAESANELIQRRSVPKLRSE